jgi:hypothetical protein
VKCIFLALANHKGESRRVDVWSRSSNTGRTGGPARPVSRAAPYRQTENREILSPLRKTVQPLLGSPESPIPSFRCTRQIPLPQSQTLFRDRQTCSCEWLKGLWFSFLRSENIKAGFGHQLLIAVEPSRQRSPPQREDPLAVIGFVLPMDLVHVFDL